MVFTWEDGLHRVGSKDKHRFIWCLLQLARSNIIQSCLYPSLGRCRLAGWGQSEAKTGPERGNSGRTGNSGRVREPCSSHACDGSIFTHTVTSRKPTSKMMRAKEMHLKNLTMEYWHIPENKHFFFIVVNLERRLLFCREIYWTVSWPSKVWTEILILNIAIIFYLFAYRTFS